MQWLCVSVLHSDGDDSIGKNEQKAASDCSQPFMNPVRIFVPGCNSKERQTESTLIMVYDADVIVGIELN